jgi:hypothetical protein
MAYSEGESENTLLRLDFDRRLRVVAGCKKAPEPSIQIVLHAQSPISISNLTHSSATFLLGSFSPGIVAQP